MFDSITSYVSGWFSKPNAQVAQAAVEASKDIVVTVNADGTEDFEVINKAEIVADLEKEATLSGMGKAKLLEMASLSKIAYNNSSEELKAKGYKTLEDYKREGYTVTEHRYENESGKPIGCYVLTKDNEVKVTFRGTKNLADIATDANVFMTQNRFMGGRCHAGFSNKLDSIWDSVYKTMHEHGRKQGISVSALKVELTGHSMGGALATLAAARLNKLSHIEDVSVVTFGAPRVFDSRAQKEFDDIMKNAMVRVAHHRQDMVPAGLLGAFGYGHTGNELRLESRAGFGVRAHRMDEYTTSVMIMDPSQLIYRPYRTSFSHGSVKALNNLNASTIGNIQKFAADAYDAIVGKAIPIEEQLASPVR